MESLVLNTEKTYGSVHWDDYSQQWEITCQPHAMMRLKAILPRINKSQKGYVTIKNNPKTCTEILWFNQLYPLNMQKEVRQRLHEGHQTNLNSQRIVQKVITGLHTPRNFNLTLTPRKYQNLGIEIALNRRALLIADEMGLGKTLQALALLTQKENLPAVAVVKVGLMAQWERMAKEAIPNITTCILQGRTPYDLPPADLYICAYTRIGAWAETIAPFTNTVIFDEIQELRNRNTDKYSGSAHVANNVAEKNGIRLGLSGTPIYNYGDEMFSAMNLLESGCLGSWDEFTREWCSLFGTHYKILDPQAFGLHLRDQGLLIRRTRNDVGIELPKRLRIVETVDTGNSILVKDKNLAIELATRVLTETTFIERGMAAREFDLKLRQITGIAKAPHVAAFARIFLEAGEPVIIAIWHREVYTVLQHYLKEFNPVQYSGSESPKEKEESLQKFKSGKSKVLIISLRSPEGIDGLQHHCATVIHGEFDWSPLIHEQVATRVDRPGQTKTTTELFVVSEDGSDPIIARINGIKSNQSTGILDPSGYTGNTSSDPARIKTLATEFLKQQKVQIPTLPTIQAQTEKTHKPSSHPEKTGVVEEGKLQQTTLNL